MTIASLDAPLQGTMRLKGSGSFELSQSGSAGNPRPTEWTVAEQAATATLAISCNPGNRLLIAGAMGSATVGCGHLESEYSLRVVVERRSPPHLNLHGIHWLHAHLLGETASATVEEGTLVLGGQEESIRLPEPEQISVSGKPPHPVSLDVDDRRSAAPHISMRTELAASAGGGGHALPTWIESHPEIAYLVIGAIAGSFLTALFDFLVTVWRDR
jgi:hypothetical protein